MTKRDFEKIKRSISGPFYPDPNPHIEVSPFRDHREEFVSTVPTDQTIDPAFQSRVKYLESLVKHVASEKYSAKSSDSQKKIFFELRDLHETIFIDNYIKNYHGSELYRKVVKIIEMNGLWERDWRRSRNIRIV